MDHTSVPDPAVFADLAPAEQIKYLQALWDRVLDSDCEIPVPAAHLELAGERLEDYRKAPEQARPAFELLDRLARDAE